MEEPIVRVDNLPTILCCECGVAIPPNPSNTCASCLASKSDISRGISTECTLHQCRGCGRWHVDAGKWMKCELESRELMSLCLSKISGLKRANNADKFRVVDAGWIWTEPHSMRLKVRLTVQKEVQTGTILQQSVTVTFVVRNQQCIECQAEFRQGSWKSLVQVRQHVHHKRTFLFLEQLILKHEAHRGCLSIETFKDGMDFYFPDKSKAARFISFVENVTPTRIKSSKKLISMDDKSNVANYKYTNFLEICPLCKDDLLHLPKKLARTLGNISRLVLVKNITAQIHLVDPLTGQTASVPPEAYWRDPFTPIITAATNRFTKYVVLSKEPIALRKNVSRKQPTTKARTRLASVTIARDKDFGSNDAQFEETSHIGYLLKAGDVVIGYDLKETQFVNEEAEHLHSQNKLPDVVLLRKLYGAAADIDLLNKPRPWKLQRLEVDVDNTDTNKKGADREHMDEEEFMREVEADKDMRSLINIYKSNLVLKSNENDEDEEDDDQKVKLDELLDELNLETGPDDTEDTHDIGEDWEFKPIVEGEKASEDGIAYVGREEARLVQEKSAATAVGTHFSQEFVSKKL